MGRPPARGIVARMREDRYALLAEILTQPTAPFRESHVVRCATRALERGHVPFFLDSVGNVVVGCDSAAEYRRLTAVRSREPLRVFIAHMDHPGFHGVRFESASRLAVKWHGGSPVKHLAGSRVWLADNTGVVGDGRLAAVQLHKSRRALATAHVQLTTPLRHARTLFGGFAFRAPWWRRGKLLYTKAADDLVGVFAVLNTALNLFDRNRPRSHPAFIGLLTRAEEVGFIGMLAHLELGWLASARRKIIAISLETSRTLPNAYIGKGPVVRLGDRRTVFDPGALNVLTHLARRVLPGAHQRRIMDGGTCEATAAVVYGLSAIGISVPLGNYHNQGFEGGLDCDAPEGPAPEFVHLDDIEGLLKLCHGLMRPNLPWDDPWKEQRDVFSKNLARYRRLLASGAAS